MIRTLILTSIATFSLLSADEAGFVPLFDGKTLAGWQAARASNETKNGAFSVDKKEKAIHTYAKEKAGSEQGNDCLVSEKSYRNYILKLEYKWGEKRFAPRSDWDRDAGLLFHVHGDLKKVWPDSLEMQIGASSGNKIHKAGSEGRFHVGDLFVLGESLFVDVRRKNDFYEPKGESKKGKHVMTRLGVEKPHGEWNEIEIRVDGAKKATFMLNGEVVFELANFVHKNKEGKEVPLDKGHLGLQAEWAEISYRNIRIKELPAE